MILKMKISLFLLYVLANSNSFAIEILDGDLCIRPTQKTKYSGPNMTQKKFDRYNCSLNLSIQVDDLPPVSISSKDGAWVKELSTSSVHIIKIIKDMKTIDSFKFKYNSLSWPKLTLWRNVGYCSWYILPRGRKYSECPWPKESKKI